MGVVVKANEAHSNPKKNHHHIHQSSENGLNIIASLLEAL